MVLAGKITRVFLFLFVFLFTSNTALADVYSDAQQFLEKAQTTGVKDESYEYIHNARALYRDKYEQDNTDIKALIGLSKTFQLIGDRREAKLYVLKAYNMRPYDAYLQREMANFHYSFQEYSTALEYYKLALASGLLKDFDTNLATAKCYEKLGDLKNAELYYQICNYLNPNSKFVSNKINEYDSKKHSDKPEDVKYKYLFKEKELSETQRLDMEAEEIINKL